MALNSGPKPSDDEIRSSLTRDSALSRLMRSLQRFQDMVDPPALREMRQLREAFDPVGLGRIRENLVPSVPAAFEVPSHIQAMFEAQKAAVPTLDPMHQRFGLESSEVVNERETQNRII